MALRTTQLPYTGTVTDGVSEVQRITMTGTVSGGSFTLTYDGQTTAAIAWDASATDVQAALEALSNIAPGDVVCTGGPLPGTPVTITFAGNLAGLNVAQISSTDSLTGTDPATAMSTVTSGVLGTYRGAMTGAVLLHTTNGIIYTNTGTPSVPAWTVWSDIEA